MGEVAMVVDRERLFGADLRLRPTGGSLDLPRADGGDLALATGAENISQALTLRLLVRRGELAPLGWPDYGSRLHELIGEPDLPRIRLRMIAYAREALEADPRVSEVTTATVTVDRVSARLDAQVLLVGRASPLPLSVSL